jgi:hypothetical protein
MKGLEGAQRRRIGSGLASKASGAAVLLLLSSFAAAETTKILAEAQWAPCGIAVDERYVYWTNRGSGTVMRVPKGGGSALVLAKAQANPHSLLLEGESLFWINWSEGDHTTGAVMTMARRGGKPRVLAAAGGQPIGQELAVDERFVYFTRGSELVRVPKTGGAVTQLASGLATVTALAVDATHVYAAAADSKQLVRVAKADGTSAVLAAPNAFPWRIVLDADNVYYTVNSGEPALFRVAKKGGISSRLSWGAVSPETLEIDGSRLILGGWPTPGIVGVPIAGGPLRELAGHVEPTRVVVEHGVLYFTEGVGKKGTVRTLSLSR